jgi:hypothetical protein
MSFNFEGFGENNDEYYDEIQRRKYLAEQAETKAKEQPFYQSNNILGSLGKKSDSNGSVKRIVKTKGLVIEDNSIPQSIDELCQTAHDALVKASGTEPKEQVVYELKIFWKEALLRGKILKYHVTFGSANQLHVFDKGPWQEVLAQVHNGKRVKYHPVPTGIIYHCG